MAASSHSNIRYNLPFNLGLQNVPVGDEVPPSVRNSLADIYAAFQQLQYVLHTNLGIGQRLKLDWEKLPYFQTLHQASQTRIYLQATEEIEYARAINIFDGGGGILKVRLASAANNSRPAHGFCTTSGGLEPNAFGELILNAGLLTGLVDLVVGVRYFLSTTPGFLSSVPALAAGNIEQALGLAVSPSALLFNFNFSIVQH